VPGDANANGDGYCDADLNGYADLNCDCHADRDGHADANRDEYADPDVDTHTHGNRNDDDESFDGYPYGYCDSHGYTDGNKYSCDTDGARRNANGYRDTDADSDNNAERI
jgi:hypothetical protein